MTFRFELLRGLFKPTIKFYQLKQSEQISGLVPILSLLILINVILTALSSYFGFGSESLTLEIYQLTPEAFEAHHVWLGIGNIIGSIINPLIYFFLLTLLFAVFYSELPFKKIIAFQIYVLLIAFIEKTILCLFQYFIGIDPISSPFSLGIIGQLLTDSNFLLYFMSGISLFLVWKIAVSIIALRLLTEQSKVSIFSSVIGLHLLLVLLTAAIKSLEIYKLI